MYICIALEKAGLIAQLVRAADSPDSYRDWWPKKKRIISILRKLKMCLK